MVICILSNLNIVKSSYSKLMPRCSEWGQKAGTHLTATCAVHRLRVRHGEVLGLQKQRFPVRVRAHRVNMTVANQGKDTCCCRSVPWSRGLHFSGCVRGGEIGVCVWSDFCVYTVRLCRCTEIPVCFNFLRYISPKIMSHELFYCACKMAHKLYCWVQCVIF